MRRFVPIGDLSRCSNVPHHRLTPHFATKRTLVPYLSPTLRRLNRDQALPGAFHLFDHLVGAGKQGYRWLEPKRLSRLEVDDQFELGGCLNR
jgi:hypothetical protein